MLTANGALILNLDALGSRHLFPSSALQHYPAEQNGWTGAVNGIACPTSWLNSTSKSVFSVSVILQHGIWGAEAADSACLVSSPALDVLAGPLQEHGQPHFCHHVAAVVAGCAVHAQPHIHARVQQPPDGRDAGGQAHVGGRAVRQPNAVVCKELGLCSVEHAAVRKPAVPLVPPNLPAGNSSTVENMLSGSVTVRFEQSTTMS